MQRTYFFISNYYLHLIPQITTVLNKVVLLVENLSPLPLRHLLSLSENTTSSTLNTTSSSHQGLPWEKCDFEQSSSAPAGWVIHHLWWIFFFFIGECSYECQHLIGYVVWILFCAVVNCEFGIKSFVFLNPTIQIKLCCTSLNTTDSSLC